jgi:hypothetical protein
LRTIDDTRWSQGLGGDIVIALVSLVAIIIAGLYLAAGALRAFFKWLFVD